MRKILLTIAILFISFRSYAACDDLVSAVNQKLHYPKPDPEASFDLSDCKAWPGNPGKIILAIARYKKGSGFGTPIEQPGEGLYDLDVLVADEKSGKILRRVIQVDALVSDAEHLDSVSVDTARYILASGSRAFGVRVVNTHLGGTNSERISIRLFAAGDHDLVQILAPVVLRFSTNSRSNTECTEYQETSRSIRMSKKSSHGYADLLINEKGVEPEMTITGTECKEVSKISRRRYTVRFDGKQYVLPPALMN